MKMCVGAVSPRVIEEAAKLQVPQIVASRRQVDLNGGYTGLDQDHLVDLVKDLSNGVTQVVRDHGGPLQGGNDDDGTDSFDADLAASFDGLHIDVCQLPHREQVEALRSLLRRYKNAGVNLEVGGEHTAQHWNTYLLNVALDEGVIPSYVVINAGTRVWADKQYGSPVSANAMKSYRDEVMRITGGSGAVRTKLHNMDWVGGRVNHYGHLVDMYNIAPEFGCVEVNAILSVLPFDLAQDLLIHAYGTAAWRRWFKDGEGTWLERAKCAVRYIVNDYPLHLGRQEDIYVRSVIRDAIAAG